MLFYNIFGYYYCVKCVVAQKKVTKFPHIPKKEHCISADIDGSNKRAHFGCMDSVCLYHDQLGISDVSG